MKENDRYTSVIWAALGFYIAFEGYRLKVGDLYRPGSGFLVFWAGIVLSALSIVLFSSTLFTKKEEKEVIWHRVQWPKPLKLVVALFVYALFLKWIGFLLSTFLLLLFLFKGLEPQRWGIAIILSVAVTGFCYLIFVIFLGFHFPEGILEKIFI